VISKLHGEILRSQSGCAHAPRLTLIIVVSIDPRGCDVQVLDSKSINLAISERGLNSLKVIDPELLEEVMKETVPMTGRCIHPGKNNFKGKGGGESQAYDIHGRVYFILNL